MPVSCCAPCCTKRFVKGSGIHFYRFPRDSNRKVSWQRALRRTALDDPQKLWEPSQYDRLCSEHFLTGKPSSDPCHPDYVPSVFSFMPLAKRNPAHVERFDRLKIRRLAPTPPIKEENVEDHTANNGEHKVAAEALIHLGQATPKFCDKGQPPCDPFHPDSMPSVFSFTSLAKRNPAHVERFDHHKIKRLTPSPPIKEENVEVHTANNGEHKVAAVAFIHLAQEKTEMCDKGTDPGPDPLQADLEKLESDYASLKKEYQRMLDENRDLNDRLKKEKFTYKNLNNSQISFLTGVPSMAVFLWILSLISSSLKPVAKLDCGDMLLIVLMKLKLSLTNTDLAMRFKTCPTQVSRVLCHCLPKLAKKLRFLLKWPSKQVIMKNMPKEFKKSYRQCRVMIDCCEISLQQPSNLDACAKTYSNSKHHNTIKFLIGITPYGAVSFLSKCWGGCVSDKEITAKSGFYEKLERGDLVVAGKGFLISDELSLYGATLAVPPFVKGKAQISQEEVEGARRISKTIIQVKKAIDRVKSFQILKNTMPISMIRHADSIITICACVTNLMPKLVK